MYNPYNWNIVNKKEPDMKMSVFPGEMGCKNKCILNEITCVSFKRDLANIEVTKILKELDDLKKEVKIQERLLEEKLVEMSELDKRLIKLSSNLPVFEK